MPESVIISKVLLYQSHVAFQHSEIAFMEFFDLVFPLKLKALTYRKPEAMGTVAPGMIVEAELKKTKKRAVVLRKSPPPGAGKTPGDKKIPESGIKDIEGVITGEPALSPPILRLLEWMSGYYMATEGAALKAMFGRELFPARKKKTSKSPSRKTPPPHLVPPTTIPAAPLTEAGLINQIGRIRDELGYRAFLLHAPDTSYERSFILNALEGESGAIVLCPDTSTLSLYEAVLRPVFGARLSVLHGALPKAERQTAYQRILEGSSDIVLGTRIAVFAPLKRVSLIAVTGEESRNYKNEETLRYNARDVAVTRAYFEGARALLTSICPSAESYANSLKGKYISLPHGHERKKIRLRIISDTSYRPSPAKYLKPGEKKNRRAAEGYSRLLRGTCSSALRPAKDGPHKAIIVVNRLGHSIPCCEDCGYVERCPACGIALVLHKRMKTLKCHYCGMSQPSGDNCKRCGGHNMKFLGAGVERVEDEIRESLPGTTLVVRTSAEEPKGDEKGGGLSSGEEETGLLLGTKGAFRAAGVNGFSQAVLINPETALLQPDFRAQERLFGEILHLADKLREGGYLYILTREPELFKKMKALDYAEFMEAELIDRKTLSYPPFSKMAIINMTRGVADGVAGSVEGAQVLGPVTRLKKGGKKVSSILVKASSAKTLKDTVKKLLRELRAEKVAVDIDPL